MNEKLKKIIKKHIKELVKYWDEIYVSATKDEDGKTINDLLDDKSLNQWAEKTLEEIQTEYNKY